MLEKNPGLKVILYGALVLFGFGLCWLVKPAPEPDIEMTIHGLFVNGKHVDLDKLKAKLPNIFGPDKDKDKGGKKKPAVLKKRKKPPAK